MNFFRALIAIAFAFAIAFFGPVGSSVLGASLMVSAMLLFVALYGILTWFALERRQYLKEVIATELNKIRRLYHLGKNIGDSANLRGWFTDLHGYVYEYLSSFQQMSLEHYDRGNGLFRKIAYHIYKVPDIKTVKEQVLYSELLETTSALSDARQKIMAVSKARFTRSHWTELAGALVLFVVLVMVSTPESRDGRMVAALVLSLGFLLALTFFNHDIWTQSSDAVLAKQYVKNLARLELRRES